MWRCSYYILDGQQKDWLKVTTRFQISSVVANGCFVLSTEPTNQRINRYVAVMVSDPTGNDPCDFDLAFDLRQHVRYAMSAMHAAFPTLRATENDAAASIVVRAMKRAAEKKLRR